MYIFPCVQDAKKDHFECVYLLKINFLYLDHRRTGTDDLEAPILISVGLYEIDILDVSLLKKMLKQQ